MKRRIWRTIAMALLMTTAFAVSGCGKKEVVFGVISDVHLIVKEGYDDTQRQENLRTALHYYKENNVDAIAVNGDMTDLGEVGAYQKFNRIFREVFPDEKKAPELILTADGHEYFDAWDWMEGHTATYEQMRERFVSEMGLESTNTSVEINGYHFIGISADSIDLAYANYSGDTIKWFEEEMAKAHKDSAKKPIFVFVHQPPAGTTDVSTKNSVSFLNGTLQKYPQAVVFTSHTHAPLQDERTIHQEYFTAVNTATLYYVSPGDGLKYANLEEFDRVPKSEEFAQGLLVRVSGNKVDIERRDFYNNATIGDNWVIENPSNIEDYTYTEERKEKQGLLAFADGAKGNVVKMNGVDYEITFDAAMQKDKVHHYKVCAMKSDSEFPERTLNVISDFYLGGEKKTEWTCLFEDLKKEETYTFEVYAVDCFGNESAPFILQ